MRKALIIGLTGGFGTGKTTVAGIFRKLGAKIIDADNIAHSLLMSRKSGIYRKIILRFGRQVLNKDKSISRKKIADIVFNDTKKLSDYQKIIHPPIIKRIKSEVRRAQKNIPGKIIILDAPLLVETCLHKAMDKLIVVKADRRTQILRLGDKFGLKKADILRRIKFQLPLSQKIKIADYVIDNNKTLADTEKEVKKVWESLSRLV
ncbi:MAG: dephospho-CoA kinase [Candidatus Omnitrophota bacterium]|nr:dephospho-CoA kinase [Candidatus Omnitrophota bacterium]